MNVIFIDVGQGDSTLIKFPNEKTLLLDAGQRDQSEVVMSVMKENNITKLDVVMGTHPHSGHLDGLIKIFKKIHVDRVYDSGIKYDTRVYKDYMRTIEKEQIQLTMAKDGDIISLDPRVEIRVLNPPDPFFNGSGNDIDNNSIVLKITYDNFSLILPGDVLEIAEESLLGSGIDADVMLASHHGGNNSNTIAFLKSISPDIIVIFAGENNIQGYPAKGSLERIKQANIEDVLRTDKDGTIILTTDGTKYTVKTSDTNKIINNSLKH
jgi:competence protein ComEC